MKFRPATPDTLSYIGSNLRPEDRRECIAVSGESPEDSLPRTLLYGAQVYTASPAGRPVVAMGIIPDPISGAAKVWLLATPEVTDHSIALTRECAEWRDRWLSRYSPLWNVVDARNTLHVRWLQVLGFRFEDPIEIRGQEFIPFQLTRDDDV